MPKAFKFRIYPTKEQQILLEKHFGCSRFIYNFALARKIEYYEKNKKSLSIYDIQDEMVKLKYEEKTSWLAEVAAQSLQSSIFNLQKAYNKFFKDKKGFPKFKSKHKSKLSFQNSQGTSVDFDLSKIYILKFKEGIKCNFSRKFEGKIKTTTISKTPSGKYYASILVETNEVEPVKPEIKIENALGLDFGVKDLIVTSDGEKFSNPKTLKRFSRRLKIYQRKLSRKIRGSSNRNKSRLRVALIHEKISNIRNDSIHKITTKLVRENQATTFCIEDLSVSYMLEKSNRNLARSIQDSSFFEMRRMLNYKCNRYGKNLLVINRFEPSSKICSNCKTINNDLTLSTRNWKCSCGVFHDRDINAAINIKNFAFNPSFLIEKSNNVPQGMGKFTPADDFIGNQMNQECPKIYAN